jgi:hypothetical protein
VKIANGMSKIEWGIRNPNSTYAQIGPLNGKSKRDSAKANVEERKSTRIVDRKVVKTLLRK